MSDCRPGDIWTLRQTFIAMIFALVVATLAECFSEILNLITNNWTVSLFSVKALSNFSGSSWLLVAPVAHAFLALIVVSVSWVGWSSSAAGGSRAKIEHIYSWQFVLLLIEVMLLILYFAIVMSNELDFKTFYGKKEISNIQIQASAAPEALQMMTMFILYALWDLVADVLSSQLGKAKEKAIDPNHLVINYKFIGYLTGILTYTSISVLCAILCWLVYYVRPESTEPKFVLFGDLALISIISFFRAGKALEGWFVSIFPWEETRDNSLRKFPLEPRQKNKVLASLFCYLVFVLVLWLS